MWVFDLKNRASSVAGAFYRLHNEIYKKSAYPKL
jgi:hypothetical protein